MEPKYLTKTKVQLNPREKKKQGYCKKHQNNECLFTGSSVYYVYNKISKENLEFTYEFWVIFTFSRGLAHF